MSQKPLRPVFLSIKRFMWFPDNTPMLWVFKSGPLGSRLDEAHGSKHACIPYRPRLRPCRRHTGPMGPHKLSPRSQKQESTLAMLCKERRISRRKRCRTVKYCGRRSLAETTFLGSSRPPGTRRRQQMVRGRRNHLACSAPSGGIVSVGMATVSRLLTNTYKRP